MAKAYYATSKIVHGDGDKGERVFEAGDQVTGLNKDQMVSLWDAGVLTERDPKQLPPDDRDDKIASLEAELAKLRADQAKPAEQEGESPAGSETPRDTGEPAKTDGSQPVN